MADPNDVWVCSTRKSGQACRHAESVVVRPEVDVMHMMHEYADRRRVQSFSSAISRLGKARQRTSHRALKGCAVHVYASYTRPRGCDSALAQVVRPRQREDLLPQAGTTHAALDPIHQELL